MFVSGLASAKVDGGAALLLLLFDFFYFFRVLDVFQVANGNYSALFTKRRVSADDVQQQQLSSVQLS